MITFLRRNEFVSKIRLLRYAFSSLSQEAYTSFSAEASRMYLVLAKRIQSQGDFLTSHFLRRTVKIVYIVTIKLPEVKPELSLNFGIFALRFVVKFC